MKLNNIPLFAKLSNSNSKNILISGCGGGFDIFTGIPLYFSLKDNYNVYLSNYSFVKNLSDSNAKKITSQCYEIKANTKINGESNYFPEKYLCSWFQKNNIDISIYCFNKTGVIPLIQAYNEIINIHNIDTIILVDGGTDSLMKGNEESLGSPCEDLTSIVAVNHIKNVNKFLVCLGFGVDKFHGINHYLFLENVSSLITSNGFYGVFTLLKEMDEYRKYKDALNYVYKFMSQGSIVNSSICDAIDGHFGDYHSIKRTKNSKLFINPLMSMYWCFDLECVANNCLYSKELLNTKTYHDVQVIIWKFCDKMNKENKIRLAQIMDL